MFLYYAVFIIADGEILLFLFDSSCCQAAGFYSGSYLIYGILVRCIVQDSAILRASNLWGYMYTLPVHSPNLPSGPVVYVIPYCHESE